MAKRTDQDSLTQTNDQAQPPLPTEATAPAQRARQSAAPFCAIHKKTRCESKGSTPFFTRYYCPEPGCRFSIKMARPTIVQEIAAADDAAPIADTR